jgi:hypothetical protein
MNNSDMPANVVPEEHWDRSLSAPATGLTKREHFCLKIGVPETRDPELDEIINKGNRIKFAGLAMQSLIAAIPAWEELGYLCPDHADIVKDSYKYADLMTDEPCKVQQ